MTSYVYHLRVRDGTVDVDEVWPQQRLRHKSTSTMKSCFICEAPPSAVVARLASGGIHLCRAAHNPKEEQLRQARQWWSATVILQTNPTNADLRYRDSLAVTLMQELLRRYEKRGWLDTPRSVHGRELLLVHVHAAGPEHTGPSPGPRRR